MDARVDGSKWPLLSIEDAAMIESRNKADGLAIVGGSWLTGGAGKGEASAKWLSYLYRSAWGAWTLNHPTHAQLDRAARSNKRSIGMADYDGVVDRPKVIYFLGFFSFSMHFP